MGLPLWLGWVGEVVNCFVHEVVDAGAVEVFRVSGDPVDESFVALFDVFACLLDFWFVLLVGLHDFQEDLYEMVFTSLGHPHSLR